MPFEWSLNPYVGCVHACQYCYARAFYERAEYGNGGADFETRILVKSNVPEVLREELRRSGWRGALVALGTATDPYQPAEGRFRLTRRALEVLRDFRNPMSLVTKSPLVFRDLDVLADLARSATVRVFFTITTVDAGLWRALEPGTAAPQKRLQVMERLIQAGVPAGVILAPILPGITDSVQSITAVVRGARDHGANFFTYSPLRLGPTVREHYLSFIARTFPELSKRYERAYARIHAPAEYQAQLDRRVQRIQSEHGLLTEALRGRSSGEVPVLASYRPQLELPLWHDSRALPLEPGVSTSV
ncbi:MAG: radical SAM protein [Chloroflexota bacterium]